MIVCIELLIGHLAEVLHRQIVNVAVSVQHFLVSRTFAAIVVCGADAKMLQPGQPGIGTTGGLKNQIILSPGQMADEPVEAVQLRSFDFKTLVYVDTVELAEIKIREIACSLDDSAERKNRCL